MMTTDTLSKLCRKVRCSCVFGAKLDWDKQDDWQHAANGYSVVLRYHGRQMTVDYWMGSANTKEPDAAGVLSSLLLDAAADEQSFEDWCSEFEYDTDSRKAEKTYQACCKIAAKVKKLLGDDYESFRMAENAV